jgi:hypothetical protein
MEQDFNNRIQELGKSVTDLIGNFSDLPVYEVGVRLIADATSVLLYCAPEELIGMKTVMAAVEIGIKEYQETHS